MKRLIFVIPLTISIMCNPFVTFAGDINIYQDKHINVDISNESTTSEGVIYETSDKDNKTDKKIDIDLSNQNIIKINNNSGEINLTINTIMQAEVNSEKDKEHSVDVLTSNSVKVAQNEKTLEKAEEKTEPISNKNNSSRKKTDKTKKSSTNQNSDKKSTSFTEENKQSTQKSVAESNVPKKIVTLSIGSNVVDINGYSYITDVSPYISEDYTLIPLREVSNLFDATNVDWNDSTKTAGIIFDNKKIYFTINSKFMVENGVYTNIPKAAEITNSRTYVPLRTLAEEALGAEVKWIPSTKTIIITK